MYLNKSITYSLLLFFEWEDANIDWDEWKSLLKHFHKPFRFCIGYNIYCLNSNYRYYYITYCSQIKFAVWGEEGGGWKEKEFRIYDHHIFQLLKNIKHIERYFYFSYILFLFICSFLPEILSIWYRYDQCLGSLKDWPANWKARRIH